MYINALLQTKEYYIADEEKLSIEEKICNLRKIRQKFESENHENILKLSTFR